MDNHGFYQFHLPLPQNTFSELIDSVDFEMVAQGRIGNHLVKVGEEGIPMVRTTTKYNIPAQDFGALHQTIADHIQKEATAQAQIQLPLEPFNNALIEVYNETYFKMGFHSDQVLDLAEESYIALFSCYEHPETLTQHHLRKLKVRSKTSSESFEFLLENNSVVLFSLEANAQFQHKIVLEPAKGQKPSTDNRWLGMTFRKSKTLIHFENDQPYFVDGTPLQLADEAQRKAFYKLRGQENRSLDFRYPPLAYTLSVGDTLVPKTS